MKKIMINCSDCFAAYTFRLNLLKELKKKYDVSVLAAFDKFTPLLQSEGIRVIPFENNTTSIKIRDIWKQYRFYRRIFKNEEPDLLINYTIKPHLFGTLAAVRKTKIINFVSGIGTAFSQKNFTFKISRCLYRLLSHKVDYYIFLNEDDYLFFRDQKLLRQPHIILESEGVDLDRFHPVVDFDKPLTFIFVGRLVEEKGIREYMEAAKIIKRRFPETRFLIAGDYYQKKSRIKPEEVKAYEQNGIVEYLGFCFNIEEVLQDVHVVVLPSYREGMPLSLIEGLAAKKFLIASDVAGCKDIVIDNYNGFLVRSRSSFDLALKMEKYINSNNKEHFHNNSLTSSKKYDQKIITAKLLVLISEII